MIPQSQPLIIGHRGASAAAPENTLAAFSEAFVEGADGVEFDVRLASDGAPVVIHDRTLRRTARSDASVDALTSKEICAMDAGSWFNRLHPALARTRFTRERVPTLDAVLELVGPRSKRIYIEMKCEGPQGHAALAGAVIASVRRYSLEDRAFVKSFDHALVREAKRRAPEIRAAALFERGWARPVLPVADIIADALACGADEISLHRSLLNRSVVAAARRRGLTTAVWTVDTPAGFRRACEFGVRAVITNRPAALRTVFESMATGISN